MSASTAVPTLDQLMEPDGTLAVAGTSCLARLPGRFLPVAVFSGEAG